MAASTCLADIANTVAMDPAPWDNLLIELGGPADLEELASIPKDILVKYVSDFEFKVGEDTKKLSLVQVGRMSRCHDTINKTIAKAPLSVSPAPPLGGTKPDTAKTDIS